MRTGQTVAGSGVTGLAGALAKRLDTQRPIFGVAAKVGKARRARPGKKVEVITDPVDAAKAAGLRYVTDRAPGLRRLKAGTGFKYVDPDGKAVRDAATLARIRALVIPPAWTDVWICKDAAGHLQCTGRDARGRKQSRYHPRWREVRDENKYDRMTLFAEALPKIRQRVEEDLALPGMPRNKVLATIVKLIETTLIRVGNEEYARENKSYGLTTMRTRHVDVKGATITFDFQGKSGVHHTINLQDRRLANIVRKIADLPGYELFQYVDEDGERHAVDSSDVNAYLHEVTGEHFTAKDFRTWMGSVLACITLLAYEPFQSEREAKANVKDAIKAVAARLGNTPTVCRKCYVHPAVLDTYLAGAAVAHTLTEEARQEMLEGLIAQHTCELRQEEKVLLKLLEGRAAKAA